MLASERGLAIGAAALILIAYTANMSAAGAWDPWETHYGEVARQVAVRHDPLDLWWQPGNGGPDATAERSFASKPALPFWLMALSLRLFGIGWSADPAEMVRGGLPELAIRLPSMFAGWLTALFLAYVVRRLVSFRAGLLTAVVLCTMPQWAMASRQALTDVFLVASVVGALGAWALAWLQPDRELVVRGTGLKRRPWDRAWFGFLGVFALAGVIPLAALHQHAFDPWTWAHFGGSAVRAKGLHEIQVHLFLYWGLAVVVLGASLRWRRRSQAWMGILYLLAGTSLMAKGLIGPGLIGLVVLVHLVVSGRWRRLAKAGLPAGVVAFMLAGLPWHHAMTLYRGDRWVNELIIQNNLQRFGTGEQEQAVGSFVFYIETLGLAAFPWVAVLPLCAWVGLRAFLEPRSGSVDEPAAKPGEDSAVALHRYAWVWAAVALFIVSLSVTKYYHYLLPTLPPLAILIGIWLDRVLATTGPRPTAWRACGAGLGIAVLFVVGRDAINSPAWLAHLTTYLYTGMWTQGAPEPTRLVWAAVPFAIGLGLWLAARSRAAVMAFVASALLGTVFVLADYIPAASETWSQRSAMRVYFDERGPEDRMVSWWFYYRGETFFTKGDVWVMKDPQRDALAGLFEEYEGKGASLWFMTIASHAHRLASHVPPRYRDGIERRYENFHYVLMRVPVP